MGACTGYAADERVASDPLFVSFLEAVKAKGFFDGVEEGTEEWDGRWSKVLEKFKGKVRDKQKKEGAAAKAAGAGAKGQGDDGAAAGGGEQQTEQKEERTTEVNPKAEEVRGGRLRNVNVEPAECTH